MYFQEFITIFKIKKVIRSFLYSSVDSMGEANRQLPKASSEKRPQIFTNRAVPMEVLIKLQIFTNK